MSAAVASAVTAAETKLCARSGLTFWKSGSDADKQAAYATLYEALVMISKLLAPTMPFMAEEMYQNLVRSEDSTAPESVHHTLFPRANPAILETVIQAIDGVSYSPNAENPTLNQRKSKK